MAIILKANKVNLFVSSVLFVFWCHSPNFLDTPHMTSDNGDKPLVTRNVHKATSQRLFCN
jgi:hypothetical protein